MGIHFSAMDTGLHCRKVPCDKDIFLHQWCLFLELAKLLCAFKNPDENWNQKKEAVTVLYKMV